MNICILVLLHCVEYLLSDPHDSHTGNNNNYYNGGLRKEKRVIFEVHASLRSTVIEKVVEIVSPSEEKSTKAIPNR